MKKDMVINTTVLCDLDGTLLDTLETLTYFVNLTLADFGLEGICSEQCRRFVGKGARNLITRSLEAVGALERIDIDEALACFDKHYSSDPLYLSKPYDGVCECVAALRRRGIPCAVFSNKPDYAVKECVAKFFPGLFDLSLGGGVYPLKPSAEGAHHILESLGSDPSHTVYVGESEIDYETATQIGCKGLLVLWGFRTREELSSFDADRFIDDVSMLEDAVLELLDGGSDES